MTEKTETQATPKLGDRVATLRGTAAGIGSVLAEGGKAYVNGITELGRALGGLGRELVGEFGQHARATVQANSMRDVAELQAAFAQHRVEMAATHAKEFVDLARVKSEEVIAPFAELIRRDKAA